MILRPTLSLVLVWLMLVTTLPLTAARAAPKQADSSDEEQGLQFRLSEATEPVVAPPASNPTGNSEPLSDRETQKLLARLPALNPEAGDAVNFKLREGSLPPPRAGETIRAAFAPQPADALPVAPANAPNNAPLEVTRFAPEGEVELAPNLTVTFSQPMVNVSSQEEAAANVPITLTPQAPGKWRWLGTQTAMFQPESEGGRLPMATSYTVTIPAGTRSALGNTLREAKTFSFATSPPQIESSFPQGDSNPRDSLMFLEFDQRIDPARMLERITLRPATVGAHLRLATPEEIAADKSVSDRVKRAGESRWLAFRAVDSNGGTKDGLPPDSLITLVIPAGTPSAEGTRLTVAEQSFFFRTFGPMKVTAQCGYLDQCQPFANITLTFTNLLDTETFQTSDIKIEPAIPDVKISAYYKTISIEGMKRSKTSYTVTLNRTIKDKFNQTLTGPNEFTFKTTAHSPRLFSAGGAFLVLDPASPRALKVYSVNYTRLRVKLYKVNPEDWIQFRRYLSANGATATASGYGEPGRLISDQVVDINVDPEQQTETALDLSPALDDGYGNVFVKVEPVERPEDRDKPLNVYANQRNVVETWVNSTAIALDAFADKKEIVVWTNALKDGAPIGDVQLGVSPDNLTGVSGADGVARLTFKASPQANSKQPALLIARRGKDVAILPRTQPYAYSSPDYENRSWRQVDAAVSLAWYVIDDRKLYRPGEEVNIKGWIRKIDQTPTGDTELYQVTPGETVNYFLKDSQDNEIAKGTVKLNALAGFNLKLPLPATMNLGFASLRFTYENGGEGHRHSFQVQEFRRPEFEVATRASEAPHFVGSAATVTMTAAYYTGGGLPDAEVHWDVLSAPTNYTPPNRDDYTFGKFLPWWGYDQDYGQTTEQSFKGRTDASGKHTIKIDFDRVTPARPSTVVAAARVQDVNRQTLSADSDLLVHPSDVYVGLKSARSFVQQGQPFDVGAIVTDLDGKALSGRTVNLRLVRIDYVYEKGEWKQVERDAQEQTIKSGADAVPFRFQPAKGGMYSLRAQVRDDRERLNETELSLWVAGGKLAPSRDVSQEKVELIPDRRTYADQDVAEVLVQSPFPQAEGVMTIRRSGLLRTERFTMNGSTHTLRIPIAEAMTPNVHVQVDLVGAAVRTDDEGNALEKLPKRPAFASGEIKLEIPPVKRRLSVKATPRDSVLEPGAETVVDVEVKDANGLGVAGTDTAVIVVDESVLALTNYRLDDPLKLFYAERDEGVEDYHLREKVTLAKPEDLKEPQVFSVQGVQSLPVNGREFQSLSNLSSYSRSMAYSTSGETVSVMGGPDEISLRKDFNALAIFAASLPTDARGHVQLKVKLPDNLTRYRVMAVSVSGGKLFGAGESVITARKQLMARPSAPRFLNYGDAADLPVVIQNQTDRPMNVSVAVRATNATVGANLTEGAGRKVTVPANNRVEVRFPILAMKPGTARFQIVAATETSADAAEISLPVYTPATTEAFATYGVIDKGSIAQSVKAPANAVKEFGGLEITTASTQLQELTDAVLYLVNYPYACSEQIASRVIAIAALKDVLSAFKAAEMPAPEALRNSVNNDLKALQGLQNDNGGFGFWRRGERSFPYVSIHVAHALVRAKSKGFTVSQSTLDRSREYLRKIDEHIPSEYTAQSRHAIQAYALYVRSLMQDKDAASARELIADAGGVEKLSIESLGWLLPVLSGDAASSSETEKLRRHLNNRVTETAGAAHFADHYSDGDYTILHSDRRADGVILEALIGDQPQSDLIPKLVRGLLSGRRQGRWLSTQENVFILLALDRYFNTYEQTTPDFVTQVWLGNDYAGEQTFKGRSLDRQQLDVPMSALVARTANAPVNLTINKEGAGRLYFRIGARYAPANLKLDAADYGFAVERKYEAIDNPADVQREADGAWLIKAGARVRVRVRVSNPARRYHVVLVDPLPAGFEPLNPELATTERLPEQSREEAVKRGGRGIYDYYWYWRGTWYEHQNLRDDRVEAFTSLLWEGPHEYTYIARATTPGLFVVPPAKAEEMYAPETFGRGHTDRVRVK